MQHEKENRMQDSRILLEHRIRSENRRGYAQRWLGSFGLPHERDRPSRRGDQKHAGRGNRRGAEEGSETGGSRQERLLESVQPPQRNRLLNRHPAALSDGALFPMHNQRFFDLSSVFHLTCFYSMLCQKTATIDNLQQPHSEHEIKPNKNRYLIEKALAINEMCA